MDLEFDKYCVVDGSPTTVLPAPRRRRRKTNDRVECGSGCSPSFNENLTETSFINCSASCRYARPARARQEPHKRGSVYQSLDDVSVPSQSDRAVGRQKIELSREMASAANFPFGIIDSLCSSDEDESSGDGERSSVASTSYSTDCSFLSKSVKRPSDNDNAHSPLTINSREVHFQRLAPSTKSRPHRSPLSSEPTCKRSLNMSSDKINMTPPSSPAHLRGLVKLNRENGLPFFEFSVSSREDISFIAKTWKASDAVMWIYTFHLLHHRRNSASNRETDMVGQMVVSSYSCTESKGAAEAFHAQECVLYDIAQSRRSTSSRDSSSHKDQIFNETSAKKVIKDRIFKHAWPVPAENLRPELEIAAVVMRTPLEKRESLKFNSQEGKMDRLVPSLLGLCQLDEVRGSVFGNSWPGEMRVVVPAGNHSVPSGVNGGPSPLLERWRLGGGCDCGGWDMGCPLDIFVNPGFQILLDGPHPVELFVQGRENDDTPAFSMRAAEGGKCAIDFHSQLSSLQAFSICVAILHAANTSIIEHGITSRRMLQGDSLGVLANQEINSPMGSISEEEEFKGDGKKDGILPSFMLKPPFSPIARV